MANIGRQDESKFERIRERGRESTERREATGRRPSKFTWRPFGGSRANAPHDYSRFQYGTGFQGYPGGASYPYYLGPSGYSGYGGTGFDPYWSQGWEKPSHESQFSSWSPRTEMFDRDGKLVVRVELPGMEKDDVNVCVQGESLVIEGERHHEAEEEGTRLGQRFYESEWSYGRFHREIPLPGPVDSSDVKAKFKNGVLELTIPQVEEYEERKEIRIDT